MKHHRTYRERAQRGVEFADKIAKHCRCRSEHVIFIVTLSLSRCCCNFPLCQLRLERICERTAGRRRSTNRNFAISVRLCEVVLKARATAKTVKVLREAREAIYRVSVRIATASRRVHAGTAAESFALCLGKVLLQPRESGLVRRDGFGDLLLRRLVGLVFEQERARNQGEQRRERVQSFDHVRLQIFLGRLRPERDAYEI